MSVVNGRLAHDALLHIFNIGEFESVKKNSTTMKYTYNEFVSLIDNCDIAFDAIAFDAMATFHSLPK